MVSHLKYQIKNPLVKAEFASRLRGLRKRRSKKLTQQQVADMLGVTRKTYGDWESPKSPKVPNDPNKLIALCEILDTSIDYLYCGVYESSREETHQNVYLTIYDRYKEDEDFKFLLRYLMGMPRSAILLLGKTIESLDEHFSGAEEF